MPRIGFLFILMFFLCNKSFAQCTLTLSTFPYNQGFESNTGSWTSGGTGNDWAWGSPSKAFITSAGGGSKCWVTGGLSGSFYNNGERSYVMSPCFDFTTLPNPIISFKIFWDCENIYDGATFQYSTDNGSTWINVGSDADPTDCMTQNWFNSPNIINLTTLASPRTGWAGSALPSSGSCQGGGGSNGWVIAKHCLAGLGGLPSVRFRFAFGAGTTCNNYDGIAFDDVKIENAPSNAANFTFGCTSTSMQYQFTNTSTLCPNNFVWNFGDPASGSSNGTGVQNPTHSFSSPGTYTVTLTISGPCNGTSTFTKTVSTIGLSLTSTNLLCAASGNGSIHATAINGNGIPTFTLQAPGTTNSTGSFLNLIPGTYTVSLTDAIGCSASATATISSSPPLVWNATVSSNITCNGLQNGTISTQATGGTGALLYSLNPTGVTNSTGQFSNLNAGIYTVTGTDANGCTIMSVFNILNPAILSLVNVIPQDILCHGNNSGQINVLFSGGTGPLNYQLLPGGNSNTSGSFTGLSSGTYTINATDANGCSNTVQVSISEPPLLVLNSIDIHQPGCNPNNDGTVTVDANGGISPLVYSIGGSFGTNNFFASMTSNTYIVIVKDANGCTVSSLALLKSINAPVFTAVTIKDIRCADNNDGTIQAIATGTAPIQLYSLSPGNVSNGNGFFVGLSAFQYTITVSDANGCTNTTLALISTPEKIQILPPEIQNDSCGIGSQNKVTIHATGGTGALTYLLQPGNISQNSPVFIGVQTGNYVVLVTDNNGCTAFTNMYIPERICCDEVFIPNAFSPNGDGRNDEFGLKGAAGIELKEFFIFNRWGQAVFKAQNLFDSWNGHFKGVDAEMGTYFYHVKYICLSTGKVYYKKGDLILVR